MKHGYAISFSLMILGSLMAYSCQNARQQEGPKHLFAEFFVRYLQTEQQLMAHATFFEGDTIRTAAPKSFAGGVVFQGNTMAASNLPGGTIRYTFKQRGNYSDTFQFRFKDDFGQRRETSVTMAPIENFTVKGGQASKKGGMNLHVEGGKLNNDESMVLLFSDEQNRASTIMLTGPSPGEAYRIPAAKVETLHTGKNTLYLVKKKKAVVKGDTLSVLADIEFYTHTIEVNIVEE